MKYILVLLFNLIISPVFAQFIDPGSGGASSIISGSTPCTGCTSGNLLSSSGSPANVVDSGVAASSLNQTVTQILYGNGATGPTSDTGFTKVAGATGLVTLGNGGSSTPQLTFTPNSGVNASWGMANGGTQLVAYGNTGATQFLGISGSLVVPSGSGLKWSAGATVTSTNDTSISRTSAGLLRVGSNTLDNSGSMNFTNLTLQGTVAATLGTATGTNVVCNTPATASLLTVQVSATGCAASSARFKEGIAVIDRAKALDDVLQFKAVSYRYRPEFNMGADQHVGFTAEQIGSVDPQWITYEKDGVTPHAVKYNEMAPLFAAAIQQLKADNDNLHAEIEDLKRRVR